MGYVNTTDNSKFIPPTLIAKTAGTWTPAIASDVVSEARTAAAATFDLLIPLNLPGSEVGLQGAMISSIDVWYRIGTAAATDFATVEVDKIALGAQTVAPSGTNPAITLDANHNTAAKRKAVEDHQMTVTITDPVFVEKDTAWYLHLGVSAAAGTVFTLYGAQVNYTLRL